MDNYIPGETDLSSYTKYTPNITPLNKDLNRKVIILATNDVNNTTLFLNGLTQNIVILYDLFESMGYSSYFLQNSTNSTAEKKDFIHKYKCISPQDLIKNPMPIHLLIEIGMSVDAITRSYIRTIGAKIVKLYLGNILNIDIETSQEFSQMFFYHHIVGEIDEIWVSPNYKQHRDYAALLNQTQIENGKVVPYVWDSCFINQFGSREEIEWISGNNWKNTDIVIMDPNISFQKCYFYSLLLTEAFARKYPEWQGKVQLINGDRLKLQSNASNFVLPSLSLFTNNRIVLHGRKNIHTILKENRSAVFMTHQWNNDFNYMTLELLYCNYPILHNSTAWDNFGYHYSINKWNEAIETLYRAMTCHKENLNIYRTHAANLIWKHSIHNPDIQSEWREFL